MRRTAVFTNKGGVGKTGFSLNFSHMLAQEGRRVLVLDMDPQNNAGAQLLGVREALHPKGTSVVDIFNPVMRGAGQIKALKPVHSDEYGVDVIPGGAALSLTEDFFGGEWTRAGSADPRAINATWALREAMALAEEMGYDDLIVDCSPSLGALTRVALLAVDEIITPVAEDEFSLMALQNMSAWMSQTNNKIDMICKLAEFDEHKDLARLPTISLVQPMRSNHPTPRVEMEAMLREQTAALFPEATYGQTLPWAHAAMAISQSKRIPIMQLGQEHGMAGAAFSYRHQWCQLVSQLVSDRIERDLVDSPKENVSWDSNP